MLGIPCGMYMCKNVMQNWFRKTDWISSTHKICQAMRWSRPHGFKLHWSVQKESVEKILFNIYTVNYNKVLQFCSPSMYWFNIILGELYYKFRTEFPLYICKVQHTTQPQYKTLNSLSLSVIMHYHYILKYLAGNRGHCQCHCDYRGLQFTGRRPRGLHKSYCVYFCRVTRGHCGGGPQWSKSGISGYWYEEA
jgi:hypothetical protein